MNRHLASCLVFTLSLSALALAQPAEEPREEAGKGSSPAWLPRAVFLGTYINEGTITPQARLQWRFPFFSARTDVLSIILEGGGGLAVVTSDTLRDEELGSLEALRLYTAQVGVSYRSVRAEGLQWGFHVATGPAWYGARFQGADKEAESYLVGLLDGRAQLGYRLGPVDLGVSVGYGAPYNTRRTSLARPFVGGMKVGLFAEWR
jgi:hypothetical protein